VENGVTGSAQSAAPPQDEGGEPWLPLALTLLALFASLGGNVYLGWIAWDFYRRQRNLAAPSPSTA
jgi:hypothetical protein